MIAQTMRKVMMILYYFPPLGGVSALRGLRYVKHMPALGWEPHVLTTKDGAKADVRDPSLLESIPPRVKISVTSSFDINSMIRHLCRRPFRRVVGGMEKFIAGFLPDWQVGWLPFAYWRARKIIANEKIDAIYTLSAPYTAHVVGYMLKRATGLPWVADFGDEWTKNPFRPHSWIWQDKIDAWMEEQVLRAADHIVIAWPDMIELLSHSIQDKTTVITCAFDEENFNEPMIISRDKFRITYTGSFYAAQQPGNFLLAVRDLLEEGKISAEEVELFFVGQTRTAGFVDFEGGILDKVIRRIGFVPHKEAVQYLRDTDVLLLIVSEERGKENIPGKTFEYLAAGRHILALVPSGGAAAKLIRDTQTGVVVSPEDRHAIREAVFDLYTRWKKGKLHSTPDWAVIRQFETRVLSGRLASVLNREVERRG